MALNLGGFRHELTLEAPSAAVPDGDGGYTQTWAALNPPTAWASLEIASQAKLERLVANTVVAQASHIVRLRFHPDLDQTCRIKWTDRAGTVRTANVIDVTDPDERGIELILLVSEVPE